MDLSLDEYRALAEFRYQIRSFLHFSEEQVRAHGLEPQQHQLLLAIKGLPDGAVATRRRTGRATAAQASQRGGTDGSPGEARVCRAERRAARIGGK